MASKLTVPGLSNDYARVMTRLVIEVLEQVEPYDKYLFCGNSQVMERLAGEFGGPRRQFQFVPHERFLEYAAGCELHLLSPGLTGAFEAKAAGRPACLLLSQNYSQYLQSKIILGNGGWGFVGHAWNAVYPTLEIPPYLPEEEAIRRLNEVIRGFEADGAAQARYVNMLIEDIRSAGHARRAEAVVCGTQTVARIVREMADGGARPETLRLTAEARREREPRG
jgi:hypothetical protein